jgi:hypothetical protein
VRSFASRAVELSKPTARGIITTLIDGEEVPSLAVDELPAPLRQLPGPATEWSVNSIIAGVRQGERDPLALEDMMLMGAPACRVASFGGMTRSATKRSNADFIEVPSIFCSVPMGAPNSIPDRRRVQGSVCLDKCLEGA